MAAVTSLYATRANLILRVDPAGVWTSNDNTIADAVLLGVSRAVDAYCRVVPGEFATTSSGVVLYLTADDCGEIRVPALQTVTALATDETGAGAWSRTWASTDYILGPPNAPQFGQPYKLITADRRSTSAHYAFPVGIQNGVKITGTWGWATTPPDISEAVLIEAGHQLMQSRNPTAVVASSDLGRMMVEPAWMPKTMKLLAPYRRMSVAVVGAPNQAVANVW